MSELGNLVKHLRGSSTQAEIAERCHVTTRTVQRIEDGSCVHLSTLRNFRKFWLKDDSDWSRVLVAWTRTEMGEDAAFVQVEPVADGRRHHPDDSEELVRHYRALPAKYQRELLLASQRQEVLRSIAPINQLVARLKSPKIHP